MSTTCFLQDCDVNLESEIRNIDQKAPYLVITGRPGTENSQYFIACEKVVHCDCKSLKDALLDLVLTYYVYDISYPKPLSAFLSFSNTLYLELKIGTMFPSRQVNYGRTLVNFE